MWMSDASFLMASVSELDDRGVLRRPGEIGDVDVVGFLDQVDVRVVEVAHDVFEGRGLVVVLVDGPVNGLFGGDDGLDVVAGQELDVVEGVDLVVVLVDGPVNGLFGGDDGLDVVTGQELDVVEGVDVRRVRGGQDQGGSRPVHRDHGVLGGDLLRNQVDHRLIDLEFVDVDRRDAVLLGDEVAEVGLVQEAELGDLGAQAPPLAPTRFTRLLQLRRREQILLDEEFPDPLVHAPAPLQSARFPPASVSTEASANRVLARAVARGKPSRTRRVIGVRREELYRLETPSPPAAASSTSTREVCRTRRTTSPRAVRQTQKTAWQRVPIATAVSGDTPKRSRASLQARW
jgi:hypothetical protein